MKYPTTLEALLRDGFTRKFALFYLNILETEKKNPVFDPDYVKWAHEHGFSAEFASVLKISEDNCKDYLSQYDFNKLWPLNNWSRLWVNDKLTLKYTLSREQLAKYMPKYYYYSTVHGLRALMDNPEKESSESTFVRCLKQVGDLACKPNNGSLASGFFKLSWREDAFYLNGEKVSEEEVIQFVNNHPNYVFTEYLSPSKEWAEFSPLVPTIRIMTLNEHGNDPRIIGNYIRIPYRGSGASNYITHDGTNNDEYNIYALIDMETGSFGDGLAVYPNRAEKLATHPDTGKPIKGTIEHFTELKKLALDLALWFNNLEYIGTDFCITTEGIKIMEINTHPMVMISQIKNPLYRDERSRRYFERKLNEISNMNEEEKKQRNNIQR